jgi:hypothetical protein
LSASNQITSTLPTAGSNIILDTGSLGKANLLFKSGGVQKAIIGLSGAALGTNGTDVAILSDVVGGKVGIYANGSPTVVGEFSSTGLAVTGTLSTTGNITINSTDPYLTLNRAGTTNYSGILFKTAGATTGGWEIYGTNVASQILNIYSYAASSVIGAFSSTGLAVTGQITSGNIVSTSSGGYTLGTSSNKWLTGYIQTISDGVIANGSLLDSNGTTVLHGKGTDWAVQRFYSSGNEKLNISSTGLAVTGTGSFTSNIGVGAASAVGVGIKFIGTTLSGVYQYGIFSDPTFSGTSQTNSFYSGGTIAASTTVAEFAGLRIDNVAKASGASVTTNYGIYIGTQSSGTTNYGIYSAGGRNYFGGSNSSGTGSLQAGYSSNLNMLLVDAPNFPLGVNCSNSGSTELVRFYSQSSVCGAISYNGTLTIYSQTSDYRLKNVTGTLTDSGAFIDALKPKIGTWKSNGSKFVGFLAHEFAEVCPSAVTGEKDSVDAEGKPVYQAMQAGTAEVIANLVAELQSLRQRVAVLESK